MTVVITKPQREETETTGAQVWCRQALRQGKTFDAGCLMMKLLYCIPLVPLMYNIAERHHQLGSLFPCASLLQSSRLGVQVFVSVHNVSLCLRAAVFFSVKAYLSVAQSIRTYPRTNGGSQ